MSTESDIQRLLDKAADFFVPAVLLLALMASLFWSGRIELSEAIMIGLSVLVVACPCALGLAAPLAGTLGLKKAALGGCLVRGNQVLEVMSSVRRVAIDKTGTLTEAKARLVELQLLECDEDLLFQLAASVENGVHHPLARAVCQEARDRNLELIPTTELREYAGLGVTATVGLRKLAVGSQYLFDHLGWVISEDLLCKKDKSGKNPLTRIYVGWNDSARGSLGFADALLPEAKAVITSLHELGMEIIILSGDSESVTERVAGEVGADHWRADLRPKAKQVILQEWSVPDHPVAMVGDGLNDAPVLAEAALGIAVGGATDLARETADVTLPAAGLMRLPWLFALSRQVQKTIYQNLSWALIYNSVGLLLAAFGLLQPVAAASLMAGSSVLIIANSLRLDRFPSCVEYYRSELP